jgi:hypothetical protein
METTPLRKLLSDRLDVADLELDIKRMIADLDYHKSKMIIFEETIKAQKEQLDRLREVRKDPFPKGEMYQ